MLICPIFYSICLHISLPLASLNSSDRCRIGRRVRSYQFRSTLLLANSIRPAPNLTTHSIKSYTKNQNNCQAVGVVGSMNGRSISV